MIAQFIQRNIQAAQRSGEIAKPKSDKPHGRRVNQDALDKVRPIYFAALAEGCSRERAARRAYELTGVSRNTIIGWHRDGRLKESE